MSRCGFLLGALHAETAPPDGARPSATAFAQRHRRLPWAALLQRVFAIDVLFYCESCGGRRCVAAGRDQRPLLDNRRPALDVRNASTFPPSRVVVAAPTAQAPCPAPKPHRLRRLNKSRIKRLGRNRCPSCSGTASECHRAIPRRAAAARESASASGTPAWQARQLGRNFRQSAHPAPRRL